MPNRQRRQTHAVNVAHVVIGGDSPVVVQSMTDTDTADIERSVAQVKLLADAGSELVRLTVNTVEAAKAIPHIKEKLLAIDCHVPLVGDFHYNGHTLLTQYPDCAKALAKYRINPGNVGFSEKKDKQFSQMIEVAIANNKPVRIGVNWGSLDKSLATQLMNDNAKQANPKTAQAILREALVLSSLTSARAAEAVGLASNKIVIS